MARVNRAEFWAELDATDEGFVRRKCAIGGYSPPEKQQLAVEWLAQRDAAQLSQRLAADTKAMGRAAFWAPVMGCATLVAALAAVAALFK